MGVPLLAVEKKSNSKKDTGYTCCTHTFIPIPSAINELRNYQINTQIVENTIMWKRYYPVWFSLTQYNHKDSVGNVRQRRESRQSWRYCVVDFENAGRTSWANTDDLKEGTMSTQKEWCSLDTLINIKTVRPMLGFSHSIL